MSAKHNMQKPMILALTFLSGFVNVMGIMLFEIPVSHFTGNITQISMGILGGDASRAIQLGLCFLLFFLGSFVTGYIHYCNRPRLKNHYEYVLVAQALFLILYQMAFPSQLLFLIAFYMGIQNGVFVFYDDIRVRFTHMTGYLTEAALDTAAFLNGKHTGKRIWFYLSSILTFLVGCIAAVIVGLYRKNILVMTTFMLYLSIGTLLYMEKNPVEAENK